jgi:hypothetical protein
MNLPLSMIVRDIARQGIEPTRRNVRAELEARHQTATDAEIDAALIPELEARWIIDSASTGKVQTSASYRNTRKQRDRVNAHVKSNDPSLFRDPRSPKGSA